MFFGKKKEEEPGSKPQEEILAEREGIKNNIAQTLRAQGFSEMEVYEVTSIIDDVQLKIQMLKDQLIGTNISTSNDEYKTNIEIEGYVYNQIEYLTQQLPTMLQNKVQEIFQRHDPTIIPESAQPPESPQDVESEQVVEQEAEQAVEPEVVQEVEPEVIQEVQQVEVEQEVAAEEPVDIEETVEEQPVEVQETEEPVVEESMEVVQEPEIEEVQASVVEQAVEAEPEAPVVEQEAEPEQDVQSEPTPPDAHSKDPFAPNDPFKPANPWGNTPPPTPPNFFQK